MSNEVMTFMVICVVCLVCHTIANKIFLINMDDELKRLAEESSPLRDIIKRALDKRSGGIASPALRGLLLNVADYFLTNIYINTEDWPGNNWAAQRERTATGRYRMVMWDAEGAFSRFGQAINSNTIDGKCLANTECSNCFRLLYPNPEFKLLIADRINKYFFNNGLLDDRDTVNSPIAKHINFFKAKVDPLLRFLVER